MTDYYDTLEIREPAARACEQFAGLPEIIARAMTAPGWARHLKGINAKSVTSRAALAKLPVLRKSDIAALQKTDPPFGGLNVTPPGKVHRLLMSPGPIFEPEGRAVAVCAPDFDLAILCTIPLPTTSRRADLSSSRAATRSVAR